jgi:aminopeptidase N
MLLAKISETKSTDQYIFQFYNGQRYRARKEGLMFGSKNKEQKGQQVILDALNDPFWNIRLLAIEKAAKLNVDNKDKGIALIKDLALKDPKSQVRSAALNFLSNNMGADVITEVYIDLIENDQSYLVVSNALKNLGKANPTLALTKAKGLEAEKSSKMITGVAQLYGSYGEKENYEFFNTVLKGTILQGFDQLSVMNSLTYFITRQEPEMIDQSFELYAHLNAEGGYYTKMFIPQNSNYLLSMFDSKIEEMAAEIALHEKNKDAVYADQARKKQKLFKDMKVKFETLAMKDEE